MASVSSHSLLHPPSDSDGWEEIGKQQPPTDEVHPMMTTTTTKMPTVDETVNSNGLIPPDPGYDYESAKRQREIERRFDWKKSVHMRSVEDMEEASAEARYFLDRHGQFRPELIPATDWIALIDRERTNGRHKAQILWETITLRDLPLVDGIRASAWNNFKTLSQKFLETFGDVRIKAIAWRLLEEGTAHLGCWEETRLNADLAAAVLHPTDFRSRKERVADYMKKVAGNHVKSARWYVKELGFTHRKPKIGATDWEAALEHRILLDSYVDRRVTQERTETCVLCKGICAGFDATCSTPPREDFATKIIFNCTNCDWSTSVIRKTLLSGVLQHMREDALAKREVALAEDSSSTDEE